MNGMPTTPNEIGNMYKVKDSCDDDISSNHIGVVICYAFFSLSQRGSGESQETASLL
jgi:hypothetical protein